MNVMMFRIIFGDDREAMTKGERQAERDEERQADIQREINLLN